MPTNEHTSSDPITSDEKRTTLDDKLSELPPERREKIEARADELRAADELSEQVDALIDIYDETLQSLGFFPVGVAERAGLRAFAAWMLRRYHVTNKDACDD
jgi:hypothetical protein